MKYTVLSLFLFNAFSLLLMHIDKCCARKQKRRIPEKTLLGCAVLGGSPGILLGMMLFHHKTRKPRFYVGVPLILLLQLALVLWIVCT